MTLVLVEVGKNTKNVVVDKESFMLELEKYNGTVKEFENRLKEVGVSL